MSRVTKLVSLSDLFEDKVFRIPDYQRGYAWEKKQIDEFIEDLRMIRLERKKNNNIHYTGMLSMKEFSKEEKNKFKDSIFIKKIEKMTPYYIIDGQQRLTTCVILISVILNFLEKVEKDKKEEIYIEGKKLNMLRNKYLYIEDSNTNLEVGQRVYKLLYLNDDVSNNFFKDAILEEKENRDLVKTLYTNNMLKTKDIFKEWIKEEYSNNNIKIIEEIFYKVTNLLKFNTYYINEKVNVNISFETMNNRGKNLSNLELLKNRLIYLTSEIEGSKADRTKLRDDINGAWKKIYNTLGKTPNIKMDDDEYLRHHWIIYFPYSRTRFKEIQNSYNRFLLDHYFSQTRLIDKLEKENQIKINIQERKDENIDNQQIDDELFNEEQSDESLYDMLEKKLEISDIQKYVLSIQDIVKFWYQTKVPENEDLDPKIKELLIRINRLKIAQVRPLTTVILSKYKKEYNDKEITDVLEKLERFLFINFAIRKESSNFKDTRFYKLSRDLNKGNISLEDLKNELSVIEDIDDNKVIDIKNILPIFERLFDKYEGFYSKSWKLYLKYFLYEYESNKKKNKTDYTIENVDQFFNNEKDKTSIEHIYPEKPEEKNGWVKWFEEFDEKERHSLMHTLGNLLPLPKNENSSLFNYSYSKKIERYKVGCQSEIEVANEYKKWNPSSIEKRGLKLIKFMEEHWDFKFKDDVDKYKFLNIYFIIKDTKKEKKLYRDYEYKYSNTIKKTNILRNGITELMYRKAYEYARDVVMNVKERNTAEEELKKVFNRESKSSNIYLDTIVRIFLGKPIGDHMISQDALKYCLRNILKNEKKEIKENALKAMKKFEEIKDENSNVKEIYNEYKNRLRG